MTTAQQKILEALASAEVPQSVDALAVITGLAPKKVRDVIDNLRDRGHIVANPKTYTVTEKGSARATSPPRTTVVRVRARRGQLPLKSEDLVSFALRTQPTSVFAMGAMS